MTPKCKKNDSAITFALMITVLYGAVLFITGINNVESFIYGEEDTAMYQNALWQAGQFQKTVSYLGWSGHKMTPFLGHHFMPMGFLYGLFYRSFPSLHTTVALYALSFAVAGFFVYLLTVEVTRKKWAGLLLMCVYLVKCGVEMQHLYFEDLAAPYVAAALYFTAKRSLKGAVIAWIGAFMFKEYISLIVVFLGIFQWLGAKFPRCGIRHPGGWHWGRKEIQAEKAAFFWIILGSAWFLAAFFGVMRQVDPVWESQGLFSELGGSYGEVMSAILTQPGILLNRIASKFSLGYFIHLTLPFGFLPILGFEYTAGVIPIVLLNFLADDWKEIANIDHYTIMICPLLAGGAAEGFLRLRRRSLAWGKKIRVVVWGGVLGLCFVSFVQGVHKKGYYLKHSFQMRHSLAEHSASLKSALREIPSQASVSGSNSTLPFLSFRKKLARNTDQKKYQFDYALTDVFYKQGLKEVLEKLGKDDRNVFKRSPSFYYSTEIWDSKAPKECGSKEYHPIFQEGSVLLCKRDALQTEQPQQP